MANTKVVTQTDVRFSYPNVFEPKAANDGDTPKYSLSCLIPKTDTKTIAEIEAAIEQAKEDGKSTKFGGKIPVNLKTPLRDGDIDRPDDPAYQGMVFFNANSSNQPGVVDINRKPILDKNEFYAGCWGRVSVVFYPYATDKGAKGVAAGLQNVMKTKDDTKLGGGSSAIEDFGAPDNDGLV